jgi:N-hydroxyarylamine O-acetyltransferase
MNKTEYLKRIGLREEQVLDDIESLRLLQRSHLVSVPFENLDIHWAYPIVLDVEKFYAKIVERRRGGFCYELNGLFETLLREIGFDTRLVSARVFNGTEHGPEFDHAAIIVTIDDEEYLSDVGFGAFSAEPLKFVEDVEQIDPNGSFVIRHREDGYFEVLKRDEGAWRSEYIFRNDEHPLDDFAEMCDFQQYAPESHFRKGMLCSIMTETGRKTLTGASFIETNNGSKTETPMTSEEMFYELLSSEFAIARPQV